MIRRILSLVLVLCVVMSITVNASEIYDDGAQEGEILINNYITYEVMEDHVKVLQCSTEAESVSISPVVYGKPVTEISERAFEGCGLITTIEIPASITQIGEWAFEMCQSLNKFVVDENNTAFTAIDGVLFSKDKRTLIKYPIGKSDVYYKIPETVRKIESAAFRMCEKLNVIDIPEYVSQLGTYAFHGCTSLTDIQLPLCIKEIGIYTFTDCESLQNIVVPFGVTVIGNRAFEGCGKLEKIEMPPTVNKIGSCAFLECVSLKSIEIPEGVTKIESGLFWECSSLESVFLPSTLKSIGGSAFYSTSELERIYYGGTETEWDNIQIDAYYNNFINDAEKYYNMVIDYGEVGDGGETGSETDYPDYINPIIWGDEVIITTCEDRDFTEIVIPPQINGKNVTKIAEGAFAERPDLDRVILPPTVLSIGNGAFAGTNINKAYFNGTRQQWSDIMFGEENDRFKNLVKIIPNGTTETKLSEDGSTFEVDFVCVENEKTVLVTLFNNGVFVGTQIGTYKGEKLTFTTDKEYTEAKVMLWDNLSNMKSLSDTENFV